MGCGTSIPKDPLSVQSDRSPGLLPDEVNRLLDRWTIGHVLIIRKRFLESKPTKSSEIDLVGFRATFSELDQTLPMTVVSAAFRQFDSRGAGALTFRDICVGLATSCLSSWEVRAKFIFSWFDLDRDGSVSRSEFETLLTCLVASVRRSVDSGDMSARFPFMSPSNVREGFSLTIETRGVPPSQPDTVERVQSCVSAVQSEVFSALEEDRRSHIFDHVVEFEPSDQERDWIASELSTMTYPVSLSLFTEWSIRNSHYLYKLLELFEIVPSPAREKRTCQKILREAQLEPNSAWYVMSYKWMQLWRSYVRWTDSDSVGTVWGHSVSAGLMSPVSLPIDIQQALSQADLVSCTSSVLQQRMGERPPAINNSDLEGELKGALKANLVEHHDFVLVPDQMWNLLHDWYGGGPSFPRKVPQRLVPSRKLSSFSLRGGEGDHTVELYPPLIIVLVCSDKGLPVKHFTKRFFVSRTDTCRDLLDQLVKRLLSNRHRVDDCRLWHRRNGEEWESLASDDPRRIDDFVDSVTTDAGTFMLESKNSRGQFVRELNMEGESGLQVGDRVDAKVGTQWRPATVVDVTENDERVKVHFDGEQYKEDAWLSSTELAPIGVDHSKTKSNSRKKFLQLFSPKKGLKTVIVHPPRGLENIGNTCFMNATLQCLSCTPMLRSYFLSGPRGGSLAGEFALLLNELLHSKKRTVAPKNFKKALDKFAPRFAGYEHQDAHELLAVLLDGLHEDLNNAREMNNRIPTEESSSDQGAKAWRKHRAENASIIADLFDGQQRVQTVCKQCGFESNIFEAFRYVMVPVPVTDDHRTVVVSLLPNEGNKILQLSVTVHRASLFQHVLAQLSEKYKDTVKIDWDTTIAAEIYLSRIHRFIDPSTSIADFRTEDKIFLFPGKHTPVGVVNVDSTLTVEGVRDSDYRVGSPIAFQHQHTEFFSQIINRREIVVRRQRRTVSRREMFGLPTVIPINPDWTYSQLFEAVKTHVSRFGTDFQIRITSPDGSTCAACGRLSCEGCLVSPNSSKRLRLNGSWLYLAIDWAGGYKELQTERLYGERKKNPNQGRSVGHGVTLYDCMDAYTAREHLTGENQWMCDKCKSKVDAERSTSWWLAPDVLVILLKRFQYTASGFEKVNVPVEFPSKDLTLRIGGNTQNPESMYDLYGVVNHTGSLSSGHYTAVCLDDQTDQWSFFNDHRVVSVSADNIRRELQDCARSSYVLFYRRKDARAANVINYAPLTDV